ncbi:hypothetical protein AM571_PA00125 (plasmid) [Rhizobium etli 8C-3]|uniref:Uncharacterized protein n=1 Tax=Rhizobium etli 8C-3 TaxID=538025 RepID=A0A1L5PA99_RHIET|nr:hypothetical protein AM571_PA00125 [Rhizobium etli 8C-3]
MAGLCRAHAPCDRRCSWICKLFKFHHQQSMTANGSKPQGSSAIGRPLRTMETELVTLSKNELASPIIV